MTPTVSSARLGIAAAASSALSFILLFTTPPDGPSVETATADQVRDYYTSNATALHVAALAAAIAAPTLLVFCACLATLVSRHLRDTVWPALIVGGGVLIGVAQWLTAAVDANVTVQALDGTSLATVDDSVLLSWYAMTNMSHLLGDLAMSAIVLTLAAASWAGLRSTVLPRWLGWAGLVVAAGGAVGIAGVTLAIPALSYAWFIGLFGWTLWLPAVSVSLLARARRSPTRRQPGVAHHPSASAS